ncbi:MAG: hypothetical protein H7210_13535, partial [Pyrinomonadaceae bacterium]|nr:hypothetical protein [Phycisphaerales bacterium]
MQDMQAKRVTVMGLGRFGGGIGVTRWLASQGSDVLVTDLEKPEDLAASVAQIQPLIDSGSVTLRLGGHNVSDFTTRDLIIASPAVPRPWDNRFLRAAQAAGIPITTEIQLLIERLPNPHRVIAVTGSAGKSTTTAMIAHALEHTGHRAVLGGNIGGSLLATLNDLTSDTWVVLELSSFMLHWLEATFKQHPQRVPHIAILTNISENHVDWHDSMAHYEACKKSIYQLQNGDDAVVFGPSLESLASRCRHQAVVADPSSFTAALAVPGAHNVENAAVALAACRLAVPETPLPALVDAIRSFPGLSHRLQLVAEYRRPGSAQATALPIRFYNDSKSTTPESALRAIDSLAELAGMTSRRIHLIAGGYDKHSDLSPVAHTSDRLAGLYTIGATGPAIATAARKAAGENAPVHECGTLTAAFDTAWKRLRPGDALLL